MNNSIRNLELSKFIFIILLIITLDQVSKNIILMYFNSIGEYNVGHTIVPHFLSLVLNWNQGISFGMLNNIAYGNCVISVIVVLIVIALFLWYMRSKSRILLLPISFIIGGAVGNLIDRLRYGAVIDFLDFYIMELHYPAFNIADATIFIGAVILLYVDIKRKS